MAAIAVRFLTLGLPSRMLQTMSKIASNLAPSETLLLLLVMQRAADT
jgi:hypothetical protein